MQTHTLCIRWTTLLLAVLLALAGSACGDSHADGSSGAPVLGLGATPVPQGAAADRDHDGVIDTADAFPDDPRETTDRDHDTVGDRADRFPTNPKEWKDSDLDGIGDNGDAFPLDPREWNDRDGDQHGDTSDRYPNDPAEWRDTDGDQVGDNADAFPNNPKEWSDSDGDTVGDNSDLYPHGLPTSAPSPTPSAAPASGTAGAAGAPTVNGGTKAADPASADLHNGLLVAPESALASDNASDAGSLAHPFHTLSAALAAATARLEQTQQPVALYLAAGTYSIDATLTLPAGIQLEGGYTALDAAHWVRSNNAGATVLTLAKSVGIVVDGTSGATSQSALIRNVTILGTELQKQSLLTVHDSGLDLRDSVLEAWESGSLIDATLATSATIALTTSTLLLHEHSSHELAGVRVVATGTAAASLHVNGTHIEIGESPYAAIGLVAYAQDAGATLTTRISHSEIRIERGLTTSGILLGMNLPMGTEYHVNQTVIERTHIDAGAAPFALIPLATNATGVEVRNCNAFVMRNSVVQHSNTTDDKTLNIGVNLFRTSATLINNTVRRMNLGIQFAYNEQQSIRLSNNIIEGRATSPLKAGKNGSVSRELAVFTAPKSLQVDHNLLVPVAYTTAVQVETITSANTLSTWEANAASAFGNAPAGTFQNNLLADPLFNGAGVPYHVLPGSPAIGAGLAVGAQPGEFTDDTLIDIDGAIRGSKIDIGAWEWKP